MQTSCPKISICVPVYGVESLIQTCAESLFIQDYDNIEYIFVNDCTKDKSIDNLIEIIEKHPEKRNSIKIINHESNKGLAGARLTGLLNSTGDYIWFLDSDDYISHDAINVLLNYIRGGYDFIIFSFYQNFGKELKPICLDEFSVKSILEHKISPSIWKCIAKRDLYIKNKILPVQGINYAEDFLLTSRLALVANSPIVLKNNFLYYYNCINEKSLTNTLSINAYEQCVDAVAMVYDYYQKLCSIDKYSVSFIFLLGYHLLNLENADKNNPRRELMLSRIRQISRIMHFMLTLNLPYSVKWNIIKAYRLIKNKCHAES